eukprot:11210575-Karenia_brevis.AAC.1
MLWCAQAGDYESLHRLSRAEVPDWLRGVSDVTDAEKFRCMHGRLQKAVEHLMRAVHQQEDQTDPGPEYLAEE